MNAAIATAVSAAPNQAREVARLALIKKHLDEVKDKLGTKCLKSERIYLDLSPRHLEYVRAHGTKIGTGWYSLESYYGEKKAGEFTALPADVKVPKERGSAAQAAPAPEAPKVEVAAPAQAPAKPAKKAAAKNTRASK